VFIKTTEHATADKPRGSATSGSSTKPPLRIGRLAVDARGLALVILASIAVTVGTFVTTWMTGRIARMNSAAAFISLLFWGWLLGIWGILLSVPIVVIVKVVSEHVEPLQPVAELLGE
jgi:predicted PurR-regulated permease PerM